MNVVANEPARIIVSCANFKTVTPQERDNVALCTIFIAFARAKIMARDAHTVCFGNDLLHTIYRKALRPFDVHLQEIDMIDPAVAAESVQRNTRNRSRQICCSSGKADSV